MNNEDTWNLYKLTPWNGQPLTDGAMIALRSQKFKDVHGGVDISGIECYSFLTTTAWKLRSTDDKDFDYLCHAGPINWIPEAQGELVNPVLHDKPRPFMVNDNTPGCLFRVTVLPMQSNEKGLQSISRHAFQKILLQTASAKYVAMRTPAGLFAASADQIADAEIFYMENRGSGQAALWPTYTYSNESKLNANLYGEGYANTILSSVPTRYTEKVLVALSTAKARGVANEGVYNIYTASLHGPLVRDNSNGWMAVAIDGQLCGIPNPTVLQRLFKFNAYVHDYANFPLPLGPAISADACLYKAPLDIFSMPSIFSNPVHDAIGNGQVYLYSNGQKHRISSSHAFNNFNFNDESIVDISPEQFATIPNGSDL